MSNFDVLKGEVVVVARRLLGCELVRTIDGRRIRVRIVETEAYHQTDAASHSYKGKTPRTEVMFGPAGVLYVYFTYGMHYCMNVVTGTAGEGAAVLIRAVEPLEGGDYLERARGVAGVNATNGPAKLCQAMGVDRRLNGHDLHKEPLQLVVCPEVSQAEIVATTRIGITKDAQRPWRFFLADNPFVSKK